MTEERVEKCLYPLNGFNPHLSCAEKRRWSTVGANPTRELDRSAG